MREIIDGKMYDTDQATKVAETSSGIPGDHDWCEQTVYRTENGAYFCEYRGWLPCDYGGYTKGTELRTMSTEGVKSLLERHNLVDTYIDEFGEPEAA